MRQICDVCPAPAMVEARWYGTQKRLFFCLHHMRVYFPDETEHEGMVFTYSDDIRHLEDRV